MLAKILFNVANQWRAVAIPLHLLCYVFLIYGDFTMKQFKYEIDETLYPAGCSKEYKLANPFIIGKRKIEIESYEVEGETIEYERCLYSPDPDPHNLVWYGGEHLTKSTETGMY